jgi:secernin
VNEKGVAIGNEAVFSRFKAKKKGILGMDILRAALAHADSAADARDFICAFVEKEEQGGNGAYKGNLVYSNSFIVAGRGGAYVVETAGRRWAWKTIDSMASISNAYSIEADYEGLDEATRAEKIGSWRERVQDPFYLLFTKGDARRACTGGILREAAPDISLGTVLSALRSHGGQSPGKLGMAAPCIHGAGFPMKSATTASMVYEYLPAGAPAAGILWFTGASHPCLSVFAPILLANGTFIPLWTLYEYAEGSLASERAWERGRQRARREGGAARSADPDFVERRDGIQARLVAAAGEAALSPSSPEIIAAARRAVDEVMSGWGNFLDGNSVL